MGMQTQIKGAFTSTAVLTAVNAALAAADLPEVSAADGIKPHRSLLESCASWPAMAVDGPAWEQTTPASGSEREMRATMTVYLMTAAGDEPTLAGQAPLYGDSVRAGIEATVAAPIIRCECTSGDADGEPVAVESPGLAARLIRQTYRVTARYVKAEA